MRPSKRVSIIEAALRVIGRLGVSGLTYETLAEDADVTKAGIVYHFPTREDLLRGLHEHAAAEWETAMVDAAGSAPETLTDTQRLVAYTITASQSATRAQLLLLLGTADSPAVSAPSTAVLDRWAVPCAEETPVPPRELWMFVIQLAADGLWLRDSLGATAMSPHVRRYLAEELVALTEGPPPDRW
ncbi:MAG: TetR/AcrR family transcriptional regulator [Propioniciclava sp.]